MSSRAIKFDAVGTKPGVVRPYSDRRSTIAVGLAALIAIAIQSLWIPIDADVSWLITVSERVLSGDRLYVDIFELNPPASVWIYVPLVWLAELIGAKPEAVVAAGFVTAGLASVQASIGFASRLDDVPSPIWLAGALSFIALVLPMALFAQREHAALLLAMPALVALAVIGEGKPLPRPATYATGFAAGLVIVIKPYFLLAIVTPALWVAIRQRSLSPLLPGIAGAAVAIALYGVALLAFARAYFEWLPMIARTYVPMHEALWKVAVGPALYPAICFGLAALLRAPKIPSIAVTWGLGSLGFLLAAYAQAKNYPNHWLPSAALALGAASTMLTLPQIARIRRAAIGVGLATVALSVMYHWAIRPDAAVAAAVREAGPPAPKIIALSPQLVTGHPVTRNVGGHWVGSRAGLFTASGARFAGLDDPLAQQFYREDINSFAIDVEQHSPDVILVHVPTKPWLIREQAIAKAMGAYRMAVRANDTEIWVARDKRR